MVGFKFVIIASFARARVGVPVHSRDLKSQLLRPRVRGSGFTNSAA